MLRNKSSELVQELSRYLKEGWYNDIGIKTAPLAHGGSFPVEPLATDLLELHKCRILSLVALDSPNDVLRELESFRHPELPPDLGSRLPLIDHIIFSAGVSWGEGFYREARSYLDRAAEELGVFTDRFAELHELCQMDSLSLVKVLSDRLNPTNSPESTEIEGKPLIARLGRYYTIRSWEEATRGESCQSEKDNSIGCILTYFGSLSHDVSIESLVREIELADTTKNVGRFNTSRNALLSLYNTLAEPVSSRLSSLDLDFSFATPLGELKYLSVTPNVSITDILFGLDWSYSPWKALLSAEILQMHIADRCAKIDSISRDDLKETVRWCDDVSKVFHKHNRDQHPLLLTVLRYQYQLCQRLQSEEHFQQKLEPIRERFAMLNDRIGELNGPEYTRSLDDDR